MGSRPQAVLAALLAAAVLVLPAGRAAASATQLSILQADVQLLTDPYATMSELRDMGVQVVRVSVGWSLIAPHPASHHKPKHFNAADPAAYEALTPGVWARWDAIVKAAAQNGIRLDFNVNGTYAVPRWASGPNEPPNALVSWDPSSREFGLFMRALGSRYGGTYDPALNRSVPGDPNDLPAVRFWSIWNEPNYGPSLSPQDVPHSQIDRSPEMYRRLVAAAWKALHATGHAGNTFLIGETAARGVKHAGLFAMTLPGLFYRSLYCVDSNYRPLRGSSAALRGCPTTAVGSSRFRAANPGLFRATGIAVHPYMQWLPPNSDPQARPDFASLAVIGRFERTLNRIQRAYGVGRQVPLYNTEFGYMTSPPKHDTPQAPYISPTTAAYYLNWAEYLHWRDRRFQSFAQYQLVDPAKPTQANNWGSFASALILWNGHPKPSFPAWVLPLYMPQTTLHPGALAEVWGCVRPAHYAVADTGQPQTAYLQFAPAGQQTFTDLASVTIASAGNCYFDTHLSFPGSGALRLKWQYPAGDAMLGNPLGGPATIYSRTIQITVN